MKVMKFGGSSVRNAEMIRQVVQIALNSLDDAPVLVASAMGKTTDHLVELAIAAATGDAKASSALVDSLESFHLRESEQLVDMNRDPTLRSDLAASFAELRSLVHGITLIRECSPRSRDALLSFGEQLSTRIVSAAARNAGCRTELVDARTLVRTDDVFGEASPDMEITAELVRGHLRPEAGLLLVTQGFIASTADGVTTTLGRGGSDFTATILGAALGADSVEIWTDVDGIMSADPRVVDNARTIPVISYDEAAELAYFGAKVVHPYTILPAVKREIPVLVRNTGRPDEPGTRIGGAGDRAGVRAIASKRGITLVTVKSSRMLNAYGFLRAIFAVFDQHGVSVDLVATSEVSVSVTVDNDRDLSAVKRDLERLGRVIVQEEKTIISIVGRTLFEDPSFVATVFDAVAPAHVRLVSFGSSEINLSLVVDHEEEVPVLARLHERLWR